MPLLRSRRRQWYNPTRDYAWQQPDRALTWSELKQAYEDGAAACWYDGEGHEQFREQAKADLGYADYADAAESAGTADSHAGKLVLPWLAAEELYPGCWPGPAQVRGDCVSHSARSGIFMTMIGEIVAGLPDEVSGHIEGPPDVTPEAIKNLVLSSEFQYWLRGYNGDGWYVEAALSKAKQHGSMLRQAYPDLNIDLTKYTYANTAKYGSRMPSEAILAVSRLHLVRGFADANTGEEIRDALGNMHGVSSDGGEGWSSTRDEYGRSKRSGRWSHSFPFIGYDDRPEIVAFRGEPQVLMMNNWGQWNGGGRKIYKSASLVPPEKKDLWTRLGFIDATSGDILIPHGAWWDGVSSVRNRDTKVIAGYSGWQRKNLPDWGTVAI